MPKRRVTTPSRRRRSPTKKHHHGGGFPVFRGRRYQSGGNFPVFRGRRYQSGGGVYRLPQMSRLNQQRGAGLGGMFRSFARTVAPHLKRGLKHVGKRALAAGVNMAQDMMENKTSFKDALKQQAKSEIKALDPINMMRSVVGGSPSKPRTQASRKRKAPSKRKKRGAGKITL
jgi:hypothetical protein